ncbi:MAG: glucose-6-phosphate isomerase [Burkholderiales bacterium]|nr:glucose-6-phosphate isomerase [Burkholderiales bacterium]
MSALDAYQRARQQVADAAARAAERPINQLLRDEPRRLADLSVEAAGLWLDLSRNALPLAGLDALLALAEAADVTAQRDAMYRGDKVNFTEGRAVQHVMMREPGVSGSGRAESGASGLGDAATDAADSSDTTDTAAPDADRAQARQTLQRMQAFADAVRAGRWRGASGRPISDILHIGIGGSHLGPQLACEALAAYAHPRLRCHFLSNVDPQVFARLAVDLNPATTLVIVASKSWRTVETARNAQAVRRWFAQAGIEGERLQRHWAGVTANAAGAREFGLADEAIYPFPDGVGGRFSLWSAIGLPVMLMIGPAHFRRLLDGAHAMDRHFAEAPPARNAPLLLALVSLWNTLALAAGTEAVVPYSDALRRLPAYLQQLQMESNGKRVDRDGRLITTPTAPVIWGEPGTDAQHSFFQALHQGPMAHPVDFIVVVPDGDDPERRSVGLLANALAQSEALLLGRTGDDGSAAAQPRNGSARDPLAVHRSCPGNRPSNIILMQRLDPFSFGALLALYEHKMAALGWLWRIDSFDQWGVELGKLMATELEPQIEAEAALPAPTQSAPLRELLQRLRQARAQRVG